MALAARSNYQNIAVGSRDPFWQYHTVATDRATVQTDPKDSTKKAMRNIIKAGDYLFGQSGTNRSEVLCSNVGGTASGGQGQEGDRIQFGFSLLLPTGFQSSDGDFNSLNDFHFPNNGPLQSPFMMIVRDSNKLRLRLWGGPLGSNGNGTVRNTGNEFLMTLAHDRWYDIGTDILWSSDPNVGLVGVWVDGVEVLPLQKFPTLVDHSSNTVYYKQGFYRDASDGQTYGDETYWFKDTLFWDSANADDMFAHYGWDGSTPPPDPDPPPDPAPVPVPTQFDGEPTNWLGGAYIVTGSQPLGSQVNRQRAVRVQVARTGTVTGIGTFRQPTGTGTGTELTTFGVIDDNAGGTDPEITGLLGTTDELQFTPGMVTDRYVADLATSPFIVTQGDYVWIVELTGGSPNIAYTRATTVSNVFRLMDREYTLGVSNWNTATDFAFDLQPLVWLEGTLTTGTAPSNIAAPTIIGAAKVGATLQLTSTGTWTGNPTSFTQQWWRDNGNNSYSTISGALGTTYTLTPAVAGLRVLCVVNAINATGFGVANSNFLGPIIGVSSRGTGSRSATATRSATSTRRVTTGGGGGG